MNETHRGTSLASSGSRPRPQGAAVRERPGQVRRAEPGTRRRSRA